MFPCCRYIGKASEIADADNLLNDDGKDEDVLGIELDEWSANGHDGKGFFRTTKGRGYFARKKSVANIILPTLFGDFSKDEDEVEIANLKRKMAKIEKKLKEIGILEEKQKKGEALDTQQLSKCDRKKHLKEQLVELKQELAQLEQERKSSPNTKTRKSLETEESIKTFNRKRRGSVNKEESLKSIQIGDRVRLVRGKTGKNLSLFLLALALVLALGRFNLNLDILNKTF